MYHYLGGASTFQRRGTGAGCWPRRGRVPRYRTSNKRPESPRKRLCSTWRLIRVATTAGAGGGLLDAGGNGWVKPIPPTWPHVGPCRVGVPKADLKREVLSSANAWPVSGVGRYASAARSLANLPETLPYIGLAVAATLQVVARIWLVGSGGRRADFVSVENVASCGECERARWSQWCYQTFWDLQ